MENFLISEDVYSDNYTKTFEAYDKKRKCWCYLTVPTVPTSWEYSVDY